jgi:hypothetical protein
MRLQGSVRAITPALFHLQALPLTAESSIGTIPVHAGLLGGLLPPALRAVVGGTNASPRTPLARRDNGLWGDAGPSSPRGGRDEGKPYLIFSVGDRI